VPEGHRGARAALLERTHRAGHPLGPALVIAAHGNSIRALVKYLDGIADDDIVGVNIPNGIPLVYELDAELKPIRSYYLGDAEAVAKAAAAVANQGKAPQGAQRDASIGPHRLSRRAPTPAARCAGPVSLATTTPAACSKAA
jgi:hypothetical protein